MTARNANNNYITPVYGDTYGPKSWYSLSDVRETQVYQTISFGFGVGNGDKLLSGALPILLDPDDEDAALCVGDGRDVTQHFPSVLRIAALIHLPLKFQACALSNAGSNQRSEVDLREFIQTVCERPHRNGYRLSEVPSRRTAAVSGHGERMRGYRPGT